MLDILPGLMQYTDRKKEINKLKKEEKKMNKPIAKYRVTINQKEREYKVFTSEQEAVNFAREMIEADGNHVFMGGQRSCSGNVVLRWMEWVDVKPKVITKSVSLANKDEFNAYDRWRAKQREIEEAKKWETVRKKFLAEIAKDEIKKTKAKTQAVTWID